MDILTKFRQQKTANPSISQNCKTGWSSDQEDTVRQVHDSALRRLARECPTGCLRWGQEHRQDLWQATLAAYRQVEEAFAAQDFAGSLAAVQGFEKRNIEVFQAFNEAHQARRLGDMPAEEVEALIIRIFSAKRINPVPEREVIANPKQLTLSEEI